MKGLNWPILPFESICICVDREHIKINDHLQKSQSFLSTKISDSGPTTIWRQAHDHAINHIQTQLYVTNIDKILRLLIIKI